MQEAADMYLIVVECVIAVNIGAPMSLWIQFTVKAQFSLIANLTIITQQRTVAREEFILV
jgi:hypothetical protein